MKVQPKKHLGQHFLKDLSIAEKLVENVDNTNLQVLEVGPGTGILTDILLARFPQVTVVEMDKESVLYLQENQLKKQYFSIIEGDFLQLNLSDIYTDPFVVVGNFPYNISTQIVFKVLENRKQIPQMVGMFQKEVAERICSKPGSKVYGILSVLTQAYYRTEYLFTVSENVFHPPPKVKSGVMKMDRYQTTIGDDELFFKLVKVAFNQRRKMLSNSLKMINIPINLLQHEYMNRRPEQMSVEDFIHLSKIWNE